MNLIIKKNRITLIKAGFGFGAQGDRKLQHGVTTFSKTKKNKEKLISITIFTLPGSFFCFPVNIKSHHSQTIN